MGQEPLKKGENSEGRVQPGQVDEFPRQVFSAEPLRGPCRESRGSF